LEVVEEEESEKASSFDSGFEVVGIFEGLLDPRGSGDDFHYVLETVGDDFADVASLGDVGGKFASELVGFFAGFGAGDEADIGLGVDVSADSDEGSEDLLVVVEGDVLEGVDEEGQVGDKSGVGGVASLGRGNSSEDCSSVEESVSELIDSFQRRSFDLGSKVFHHGEEESRFGEASSVSQVADRVGGAA
jgi:hypothetical protein